MSTSPTPSTSSSPTSAGSVTRSTRSSRYGRRCSVVHIGGGGGTYARYLAATRTESRSELIEVDPLVVDVARRHLGLQSSPRLKVHLGDARTRIAGRTDASADVVVGDAFLDGLVPAHLATTEFATEVARVLAAGGHLRAQRGRRAAAVHRRRIAATLLGVFPEVALVAAHRVYTRPVGRQPGVRLLDDPGAAGPAAGTGGA